MPFNNSVWEQPSVAGDVGGIAIDIVVALNAIQSALEKLAADGSVDISNQIEVIEEVSNGLHETFRKLTGWIGSDDA